MSLAAMAENFFAYESRLASFQIAHKRRGSSASARSAKSLTWPHKAISAAALAKAGFFFNPLSSNPDNVACFLCHKSLDGWEDGDNPLEEHLKHSAGCGWAIVAAIEADLQGYSKENPNSKAMVEARKATFAGKWPHEGKKGWKCKTKQLADAGWKYTPTPEYDDMATCAYCHLALDGWEPGDKPLDEHYKRSSDCPFFTLGNQNEAPKKAARGKGARTSKVSRLSTQSSATAISEPSSDLPLPAEPEDSIVTTASKKGGRTRKAAPSKARKTKAKKGEEAAEAAHAGSEDLEMPPPPRPNRARKRGSDAMDDSVLMATEPPAAKKRATRVRGSTATESSVLSTQDTDIPDFPPAKQPAARKKGIRSSAQSSRKTSSSSLASKASTASLRGASEVDEAEIERQLEADLDRPLTDDELMVDSDSERKRAAAAKPKAKGRPRKGTTASQDSNTYAMFDPSPAVANELVISAELKAMEDELQAEDEEAIFVPKKGRKVAGTRKVSKQTKDKKTGQRAQVVEPMLEAAEPAPLEQVVAEAGDDGTGRGAAGVEDDDAVRTSTGTASSKARGRPRKRSGSALSDKQRSGDNKMAQTAQEVRQHVPEPAKLPPAAVDKDKALPMPPSPKRRPLPNPPSTPGSHISPSASARQAALSPSQSPQSSDAENQPPSSKPTASSTTQRVALAPAQTPRTTAASPSRRNVLAGLQSTTPWTAVDLGRVLGTPKGTVDKENAAARFLARGSELTSPEKGMTVEQWIYFNAGKAEEMLRHECETVVSRFETEGTRAMQALEGIVLD